MEHKFENDDYSSYSHPGDQRLREQIYEALLLETSPDASLIEVEVDRGEVTLKGSVKDEKMRKRAEQIASEIPGVAVTRNFLTL